MFFSRRNRPTRASVAPSDPVAERIAVLFDACTTRGHVIDTLRDHGRAVTGADGVTVVRRDAAEVHYVTEDAISPLWTGQSFPLRMCIGGLVMLEERPIVIPDITLDKRVPLNAYLGTFVRSMAMMPIGRTAPEFATGAYWREIHPIEDRVVARQQMFADAAAAALARIDGDATRHAA
jgi:hypothetical protein